MKIFKRRTLIIGTGAWAQHLLSTINRLSPNNEIVGCLRVSASHDVLVDESLCVGMYDDLQQMVDCHSATTLLFAEPTIPFEQIYSLLAMPAYRDLNIFIAAETADEKLQGVKDFSIDDIRFAQVSGSYMPAYQRAVKRLFDFFFSFLALLLLSPFVAVCCLLIGKRPIYKQERIGRRGEVFLIYKLRTMCLGAEKKGPQLSSENDPRITRIGRFLRRYRLDEVTQFYNVLKGDMSLIGPRPERWFYFRQIVQEKPLVYLLCNVRPGISSMGVVKYGYASNLSMMLNRIEYEMLYFKKMSLWTDLKVIAGTIVTIFKGRGV